MEEKCIDCEYSRQCVTMKQINSECCLKDRNNEKKDEIKIKIRSIEQQAIDNLKAIINCGDKIIDIEPPLEETCQIALDCITNLEQENKRLKEEIEILTSNDDNENVWLEDYNM